MSRHFNAMASFCERTSLLQGQGEKKELLNITQGLCSHNIVTLNDIS